MSKSAKVKNRPSDVQAAEVAPLLSTPSAPKHWLTILSVTGALLLFLAIYLLRLDRVVGLFYDDAWYVLLAKALASGQGYQLINSPTPGIPPLYPPAFPFLLSLVFRIAPEFPQNVWLLKSVLIVAMLGVGLLSYYYFARVRDLPRYLALAITMATVLSPALVFAATSTVMSEAFYILLQLALVVVIERGVRQEPNANVWRYAAPGALLAALIFLTRTTAIGLVAAVVLYLLKERLWRATLIFTAGFILLVGPWQLYAQRHKPTPEQQLEQGGYIIQSYTSMIWHNWGGVASSGKATVSDLPARVWKNTVEIISLDFGSFAVVPLYRPAELSGREMFGIEESTKLFLWLLGVLVVAGYVVAVRQRVTLTEIAVFFSLLIVVIWPWRTFRYVLPLLPFVLFYLLLGVQALHRLYQHYLSQTESPRAQWITLTVLAWAIVGLSVYDHVQYCRARYFQPPEAQPLWLRTFEENLAMMDWMRQKIPADRAVATSNPQMVYLYSGLKTVNIDDTAAKWELWKRLGVRYMAYFSLTPVPPPSLAEAGFNVVYRSKGGLNVRVMDLGPKESRPPWGEVRPPTKIDTFN